MNFRFTCEIAVYDAVDEENALNQLQIMLDDYADMNEDAKEIIIKKVKTEKFFE